MIGCMSGVTVVIAYFSPQFIVIIPTKDSTYREMVALSVAPTAKTIPPSSAELLNDDQGEGHMPPAKRLKGATGEMVSSPSGVTPTSDAATASPNSPAEAPGQHGTQEGEPDAAQPPKRKYFGGLTQRQA